MTSISQNSSFCPKCNGAFTIRILPAKKVPKKAKKLLAKTREFNTLTKFQKYLLQHASPSNSLKLSCKICKTVQVKNMIKPIQPKIKQEPDQQISTEEREQIKQLRKLRKAAQKKSLCGLSPISTPTSSSTPKSTKPSSTIFASSSLTPATATRRNPREKQQHESRQKKDISNLQKVLHNPFTWTKLGLNRKYGPIWHIPSERVKSKQAKGCGDTRSLHNLLND